MRILDNQLSRSLCFNFFICLEKNNLFLAQLPEISVNLNEINIDNFDDG